jgi:hypothetical protein
MGALDRSSFLGDMDSLMLMGSGGCFGVIDCLGNIYYFMVKLVLY